MDVRRQPSITICCAGFTLIEVTLALLIAAIVLSLVYGSLKGVSGSVETVSLRNELYRTNYALLEEMGRELSATFLSMDRARNPLNTRTYFHLDNVEENDMTMARLYFTTYGHAFTPNPLGESDQSEVCYHAQYDHDRDELIVLKREGLATDDVTCRDNEREAFELDNPEGDRPYVVATGIHPERGPGYRLVGFEVVPIPAQQTPQAQGQLGAERDQREPDRDQIRTWDTENDVVHANTLPRQVRVTLTYEGPQKDIIPFTRTVWLQLNAPVAQVAAGLQQAQQLQTDPTQRRQSGSGPQRQTGRGPQSQTVPLHPPQPNL